MTSLFENATEGILLTDGTGTIVLANPSAEQIFGYDSHELIGKPIETLIPVKFSHHAELRKQFYKTPSNRTMGSGRDLYAVRKDRTEFPVEISLSHYRQDQEQYVIAFIVDITTRKDIEKNIQQKQRELESITQEIQQLNTQLEAKVEERTAILKDALEKLERSQVELNEALKKEKQLNELKSRFVSMASHEFRTPLSTILSSATLVSKYPLTEDEAKREKHISRIKDAVNHMNELLEDFLSLGKLEENRIGFAPAEFAPQNFFEEVVDEMRAQVKNGQTIEFDYEGEDSFFTDKRILKVTLLNLLSNAIKFSGEHRPIRLKVSNKNETLKILVKDSGIGIPEEDIPYLFDTFFRSKNASNIQGTGLGLPIIKRYLQLLDGSIQINSQLGKGTEVLITLPKGERQL
ncbi:MAG: PAS domain-containing sensor histidine kinase [Chitinophagaceae bacterium]|nr:PAS domain-containing sensor histidine kinase [Chitinophagaceae bacterium]MCW5925782.1 PAS domain-containing sensor histidine kinase [Chitinophagaceae bacterium]